MTSYPDTNLIAPMNEEQRELARHALGLNTRNRVSYRNRFIASECHDDYENWMWMVNWGYAKYRDEPKSIGGSRYFYLTREGAEQVLVKGESLCPEDFPNE